MANRTHKKRPRDPNQLGKMIVDISVGEIDDQAPAPDLKGKDPAAVSLGRRGGLKGGAQLLALDARDEAGQLMSDYYLMPSGWLARELGRRFAADGSEPLALVTSVSPPGARPMEAMLSISRIMKK